MNLREAISLSFKPEVWEAIQDHLSPPELLKLACLEEFKRDSYCKRVEALRGALVHLDIVGSINMNEELYDDTYDPNT